MAGTKISALSEMATGTLASGDFFVVVDTTAGTTLKIDADNISEAFTTAYTRTLLDDANAAAARTTLGVGDLGTLPMEAMSSMTHLLYPSTRGGYGELYLNGWKPIGFNQQWGGPWGGDRPNGDGKQEWFPTGYIAERTRSTLGAAAATTWQAQAFKVPETITADAVWIKLSKVGNPQKDAEPFNVYIVPDSGGEPDEASPITNGTMDTMDGPGFSGESMASASEPWPISGVLGTDQKVWYRFSDASGSFSLTKNTTYYVVVKATGADAANNFVISIKNSSSNQYPHGNFWNGDDAVPSNWTEDVSAAMNFLIESSSGTDLLQSGGTFDGMLEFGEGTPNNESRCIQRPLKDFWNDEEFTMRLVTSELTASKTLLDINYGLLHKDRILLRVDGSNHLVLTVYESDATTHTVTGTTDVTSAGTYDIMLSVRMKADALDHVKLYLDGATEGTQLSAKTITIDPLLKRIGHITLGGGFPVAPTWTKDFKTNQFAGGNKPSNDANTACTVAGAATEANTFLLINNDALWMNYATSEPVNDSAFYDCDPTYVAATGGNTVIVIHPQKVVNTVGELGFIIQQVDSTNRVRLVIHEYYLEIISGAGGTTKYVQFDFLRSPTVVEIKQKGSNCYVYLNGALAYDGTGDNANAVADNFSGFGDADTTALAGAAVTISEWLVYIGGPLYLEVNGSQLSEFACWDGDLTGIADDLYNSGTNLSVKQVCGISKNMLSPLLVSHHQTGFTASPTTTSTTYELMPDMECFTLLSGLPLDVSFSSTVNNNTLGKFTRLGIYLNGNNMGEHIAFAESGAAADYNTIAISRRYYPLVGLIKVEGRWSVNANTGARSSIHALLAVMEVG